MDPGRERGIGKGVPELGGGEQWGLRHTRECGSKEKWEPQTPGLGDRIPRMVGGLKGSPGFP